MPNEVDITESSTGVKILRANNVEFPLTEQSQTLNEADSAELAKLRSAFIAGEKLKPEQLNKMMALATERAAARNGNCDIC